MKPSRRNPCVLYAQAIFPLSLLSFLILGHPAMAQEGAAPGATGGAAAVGSAAPSANAPAPGVSAGEPSSRVAPGQPLTLADVVRLAIGDNSGLTLAQQRLQQAQELINQVNAQNKPQISADTNDTYSSYASIPPTLPALTVTNPTLPGGGAIPTIIDQADDFSTSFIGGEGGISAAPSTGTTPGLGTGTTNTTGTTSTAGTTGGTPSVGGTNPVGSGTGTATPGTASPGVGTPNTAAPAPTTPGAPSTGTTSPTALGAGAATPGLAAPSNGGANGNTGSGAGGAGTATGGTTGTALYTVPSIVLGYVADMSTLTQPPLLPVSAPAQRPSVAPSQASSPSTEGPHDAEASQDKTEAQPRQPGDTGTTGTGTTTSTADSGNVTPATTDTGQRNTYAARIAASQYIDLFGLIPAARDAQNDVRDFYAFDITRLRNETALAAKDLFFNVLFGEAEVSTEQEQVTFAQENVRITQDRFLQGIVAQYDVLTAQTALATAQQQLIAAEDVYDLAQSNLNYLLGTNPDQTLNLVPPPLPALDTAVDLGQSTQLALRQRPEIGQASRNINEAQRLVRLAGDTLLPIVGVVGNLEHTNASSITEPQDFATISAEVDVPIDDAGATRSRVRSARISVQTQVITQSQLQQSVSLEVRQAAINVRNAQAQIGAAQTAVTQSQAAVKLAYDRYQAGIGTFLDVLNSLAQLATARLNLANGQYFYQTSLAQLVRDMGGR